jgi:hypothetical protein
MELKRVLIKYENLSHELKEAINEKFPFGVDDFLMKVPKGKNDFFYAFTFDHGDTRYMVKVSEGTVMLSDEMLEEEEILDVEESVMPELEGMDDEEEEDDRDRDDDAGVDDDDDDDDDASDEESEDDDED